MKRDNSHGVSLACGPSSLIEVWDKLTRITILRELAELQSSEINYVANFYTTNARYTFQKAIIYFENFQLV